MAEILFWTCLLLVLQTYVFYPVMVALLGRGKPVIPGTGGGPEPTVSVIIAVFNEDAVIRERVDNIYAGTYPREKIEVLVGSDGSTDRTNEILTSHGAEGFKPFIYQQRRGKAAVLNDLLTQATGEIIVFSDANTVFSPDTVAELVKPFSDEHVGAVTGELVLQSGNRSVGGEGEVSYWRFENWLKHAESDAGSTLGASGAVYAIRKDLWRPLPYEKSIVDDFLIPMNVLKSGHAVKYSRSARAFEKAADSVGGEFRRKVRIGASNFNGLSELLPLLNPRFGFTSFALWSHKILRWFVPFFLCGIAAASLALRGESDFYRVFTDLEIAFAVLALFGLAADRFGWRVGVLGYPYYFLAMNAALFLGFFKAVAGRQTPEWEVVR